jgi:hypothetical protein
LGLGTPALESEVFLGYIERLKGAIRAWGEHPDSFFANVHVEVIG